MTAVCEPPAAAATSRRPAATSRRPATSPTHADEGRRPRYDTAREAQEWVAAATGGDSYAIGRLLAILRPAIMRYCRSRISSWEASAGNVDDIAQEVCVAVLRALPRYQCDDSRPFLGFVYGIAAHKIADARREAARSRTYPTGDFPDIVDQRPGPEEYAIALPQRAHITALLDMLPEGHRRVLVLRFVIGLSAAETATAIGSTPGAVRVAQHRALTRIRATIETREETGTHPAPHP